MLSDSTVAAIHSTELPRPNDALDITIARGSRAEMRSAGRRVSNIEPSSRLSLRDGVADADGPQEEAGEQAVLLRGLGVAVDEQIDGGALQRGDY